MAFLLQKRSALALQRRRRVKLTAGLSSLRDGAQLSGEVHSLHDTYGFPIDLTREIAANAGHVVDMDAFDAAADRAAQARSCIC